MKKRKSLKSLMRNMEKAGENLGGVVVDKDPVKAKLELDMLGVAARVKKEGIS